MPNPFGAISGMIGSVAEFLGENAQNYELYQRYGPQYREILDRQQQGDKLQQMRVMEDLRNKRAARAVNEQQLDTEKERTRGQHLDNFEREADALTRFQEAGIDFDPSEFGDREAAMKEFLRVATPGLSEVEAGKSEAEEQRERDFANAKAVQEKDAAEARIREIQSRIDENLAQAEAAESLGRQRDARTEQVGSEQGGASGSRSTRSSRGGGGDKPPVSQQNALTLAIANDLLITEGPSDLDVTDDAGPIPYDDLKQVPRFRLQRAMREAAKISGQSGVQSGRVSMAGEPAPVNGENAFTVRVQVSKDGKGGGQVKQFSDRDEEIETRIQQKAKTGEPLTPFEQAYIDAVAKKFGRQ